MAEPCPVDAFRIQEKLEVRLNKVFTDLEYEESVKVHHNHTVYASKRGLNLQIHISIRPKEGT